MERQKFEESLKHAFDHAEISPSEGVWTNVELDLEKAKGNTLKRRLLFFQMLAAASVVFAMGIGVGVFIMAPGDSSGTNQLAINQKVNGVQSDAKSEKTNDDASNEVDSQQSKVTADASAVQSLSQTNSTGAARTRELQQQRLGEKHGPESNTVNDENFLVELSQDANKHESLWRFNNDVDNASATVLLARRADLTQYYQPSKAYTPSLSGLKTESSTVDPVTAMLAKLEARERALIEREEAEKENDRKNDENLWTSVGFSAGSFTAVNTSVNTSNTTMALAQNTAIANEEVKASGIAYSVGANVGTRISERWIFQGGVNYLTQSSEYTANNVIGSADFSTFRPATINDLQKVDPEVESSARLVSTSPYSVNNSLRYLSVPLQAGYMVVDRDFGLQLNAGVATDVFLQNTVSAEGANLAETSNELGGDTPYRSVNFSGLIGTEFSYRFADRYRISLNPGLRYPFNSIYRSELAVRAMPLTFDIGLRFRYIFR